MVKRAKLSHAYRVAWHVHTVRTGSMVHAGTKVKPTVAMVKPTVAKVKPTVAMAKLSKLDSVSAYWCFYSFTVTGDSFAEGPPHARVIALEHHSAKPSYFFMCSPVRVSL
jgi:hypothetical protein